jgi:hypothetical protein
LIAYTRGYSDKIPYEYALLSMCRDVYHCTPSELMAQPADIVNLHMWMLGIVQKYTPKSGSKKRGGR